VCRRAGLVERQSFFIFERFAYRRIQRARQQTAAQASNAEARWLLRRENHQLDRAPRPIPAARESSDCLETAEHSNGPVVHSGIGNGIDMRTRAHRSEIRIRARPAREGVADRIFTHSEPRVGAQLLHERARAKIGFAKHDARYHRCGRRRDGAQRLQLASEPLLIDRKIQG